MKQAEFERHVERKIFAQHYGGAGACADLRDTQLEAVSSVAS